MPRKETLIDMPRCALANNGPVPSRCSLQPLHAAGMRRHGMLQPRELKPLARRAGPHAPCSLFHPQLTLMHFEHMHQRCVFVCMLSAALLKCSSIATVLVGSAHHATVLPRRYSPDILSAIVSSKHPALHRFSPLLSHLQRPNRCMSSDCTPNGAISGMPVSSSVHPPLCAALPTCIAAQRRAFGTTAPSGFLFAEL